MIVVASAVHKVDWIPDSIRSAFNLVEQLEPSGTADKGETGTQDETGTQGATGTQGTQGETGTQGQTGTQVKVNG